MNRAPDNIPYIIPGAIIRSETSNTYYFIPEDIHELTQTGNYPYIIPENFIGNALTTTLSNLVFLTTTGFFTYASGVLIVELIKAFLPPTVAAYVPDFPTIVVGITNGIGQFGVYLMAYLVPPIIGAAGLVGVVL